MKLICSYRFKTNCTRFAKSCIVAVFSLFSCSAIAQEDANTAAIASDVETILQSLNWSLRNPVTSSPGYIPDRLDDLLEYDTATYKFLTGRTSTTASINYNDKNALPYLIGSLVYGLTGWAPNSSQPLDHSLHGDLTTGNETLLQLLQLLTNISNVVSQSASSVVVSNFVSFTNTAGGGSISPDILAGNPWWNTNSWFTDTWETWNLKNPHPRRLVTDQYSFPEIISIMLAQKTVGWNWNEGNVTSFKDWWDAFGTDEDYSAINWSGSGLTWYDWVADAFKSNLLLVSTYGITTGTNDLVAVSQSTGSETIIDDGETTNTNVLDELTLEKADTDAISGLTDFIDAERVGGMFDSMDVTPDPQLRLFPGGRYGDVTVDAVYADFMLPDNVASIISLAARWLWHILVMVSLFCIVRQEFDYWSTLGGSAGA